MNSERKAFAQPTPALYIQGNGNRIIGNTFSKCKGDAIVIHGDNNIIMNNIVDRDIVICGNNNVLANNIFTNEEAGIVVSGHSSGNEFINIQDGRIRRIG